MPGVHLLDGFSVESLLAVSLCQLSNTKEGISWEYSCAMPNAKMWVGKAERNTDISGHYLVFHIIPLYSFEQAPNQTTHTRKLLDWLC